MSEFTCPKCRARNRPDPGQVGCRACGFGCTHEQRPLPSEPQQNEVQPPPGFRGKYLTEQL